MGKLSTASEIYGEGGFRSLLGESGQYALVRCPASDYLKSLLGTRLHLKLYLLLRLGYWPQIRNPRTFNEKVAHRKLYTDERVFSVVGDKWRAREYVADRVGEDILTEVYHVTKSPDTIPFDELPSEFVVKPTHLCGPVTIADEETDRDHIRNQCREWLAQTHGEIQEEYWYQEIEPRIIVEERLRDGEHDVPLDFKFFVFHGDVEYIQVDFDRFSGHTRRFYDTDWNPQAFTLGYPLGPEIEEPARFERMKAIAETLGEDFDFVRVDLYQPGEERVVFGEFTIGPESGAMRFAPQKYDLEFGSLW